MQFRTFCYHEQASGVSASVGIAQWHFRRRQIERHYIEACRYKKRSYHCLDTSNMKYSDPKLFGCSNREQ